MRKDRFLSDKLNDKSLLHMRDETDAPIVTIMIKEKSIHSVNVTVSPFITTFGDFDTSALHFFTVSLAFPALSTEIKVNIRELHQQ